MKTRTQIGIAAAFLAMACAARADILFFDDFEDDTAGSAPVLTLTGIGGDDVADVGTSWTLDPGALVAPAVNSDGGSGQYLNLGRTVTNGDHGAAATAGFTAALLDGTATVSFDYLADFTPAGSTTAGIIGSGAGGISFHLEVQRGASMGFYTYSNGVRTLLFNLNNESEWRTVTLTLGASSYNIQVTQLDGTPTPYSATGLGYDNAGAPTSLTGIRLEDNANNASRNFWVDNLSVSTVPEPGTFALCLLAGAALLARRHRRA